MSSQCVYTHIYKHLAHIIIILIAIFFPNNYTNAVEEAYPPTAINYRVNALVGVLSIISICPIVHFLEMQGQVPSIK